MAVKTQRGAREAIQHLSSIITDCAIPKVPSELFRQAKFNKDEATAVLWTLLLNVVQLLLYLESRTAFDEICDSLRYHSLSHTSSDRNTWQVGTMVVKKYLLSLGYTRVEFYCTPIGPGSRELLMAFGWLIQESELMKKLFLYHLERADATVVPLRATQAFIVRERVEECDKFNKELSQILSGLAETKLEQKSSNAKLQSSDIVAKVDEGLQKLAWLRGKLLAEWKSTLTARLAYVRLAHRLHRSTLTQRQGSEKPPHLNVHELFLLRYPDHLSSYIKRVEHHVACLQRLLQWQLHERVFWQWMESVLDLHEREKASLLEQKQSEESENSVKSSDPVEFHMESLENLTKKVQALEKQVFCVLERHKTYFEKIQRVWQIKVKSVHYEEVEREVAQTEKEAESLLLRSNCDVRFKLCRVRETMSTVEGLNQEDRAVYVAEASKEGTKPTSLQRKSTALSFLTPLQEQQQSDNAKMLHDSRCYYGQVSSELERTHAFVLQQREDILRQLHSREANLPTSLCKIET